MVYQLLVDLPRTLKGQNGVEYDLDVSSLRRKNVELLGLFFLKMLGLLKIYIYLYMK